MPFLYIPGQFRPDLGRPDGDSVRFLADDLALLDQIESRPARLLSQNTVQLRYEGIDTLEKNAIEPFASDATNQNISLLRNGGNEERPRGFILSRMLDRTRGRRPLSLVYSGELDGTQPGERVFVNANLVRRSVNFKMVEGGFAYPFFFNTFFSDLRQVFIGATQAARTAQSGLWLNDATNAGFEFHGQNQVDQLPPIFPRLFRRLEDFGDRPGGISGFLSFIENMGTELMVLSDGHTIGFEDIIETAPDENTVRMTRKPEELVFFN